MCSREEKNCIRSFAAAEGKKGCDCRRVQSKCMHCNSSRYLVTQLGIRRRTVVNPFATPQVRLLWVAGLPHAIHYVPLHSAHSANSAAVRKEQLMYKFGGEKVRLSKPTFYSGCVYAQQWYSTTIDPLDRVCGVCSGGNREMIAQYSHASW